MARIRKITPARKSPITQLLESYKHVDVTLCSVLKKLLSDTLQGMIDAELDDELGYSKYYYDNKHIHNGKNGYSEKSVLSSREI